MNIDNSQNIVGDGNNQVGGSAKTRDLHTSVTSPGELSTDAQKALQTARDLTEQTITDSSDRVRMVEAVKKAEELAKQGKRSKSSDRSAVLEDIRNIAQASGSTASGIYYSVKAMLELTG